MAYKKPAGLKTKEAEAQHKKEWDKNHTIVKGRFVFKEVPGGTLVFSYVRYQGDPIFRYSLKDGDIVELPYMVAKHLATGCYEEIYTNQVDSAGKPITVASSKRYRTGFERLDFDDDNFIPSNIIMAETRLVGAPI